MIQALAEAAKCGIDVPVGALVYDEKAAKIIASGFNQRETLQDPLGHAEIIAIRKASELIGAWRLSDLTLVCTLEPCPMCAEAIIQTRMKKVLFGAFDLVSGAAGSVFNLFVPRKGLPTPEVFGGILEKDCSLILSNFFAQKRAEKHEN